MPAMKMAGLRSYLSNALALGLAASFAWSYACHDAGAPRREVADVVAATQPSNAVAAPPSSHRAAKLIAVTVPRPLGHVSDYAHLLSDPERSALDGKLLAHEKRTGQQLAVAIWSEPLGEQNITNVGFTIAQNWKLGRVGHDDGLLIVLAPKDRKVDIEVGRGLERAISDEQAARVIDERMTPKFREGRYAAGLEDGVDELIRLSASSQP
jgi:uncharacterized protein